MGVVVIACYRPKPGRAADLEALVRAHLPLLIREGLAEDRPPLAGRAADGTIVEAFVWTSRAAIESAHGNAAVAALWAQFAEVADFAPARDLAETANPFAEFEAIALAPASPGAAVVAGRAPIAVDVEAGKTYFWCACGRSARQPFCDGAHKGTGFEPQKWTAPESRRAFFCACKKTSGPPLCDGSHNRI